ncbi:MAG TPA: hypothetical protein VFW39_03775 [Sphingomicrobium sp.]|nr:hypothetical protein [Sphingomicrobium sp.]
MRVLPPIALALVLAGCGTNSPVARQANNTANLIAVVNQANAVAKAARAGDRKAVPPGAPVAPTAAPPIAPAPARSGNGTIPAALQGRWGLTPGDCTVPLSKAKGLMVVAGNELSFYGSRAVPTADAVARANSFNADFRFSGEGRTWVKFETLQLNGDKLVRTESNPAAGFTYARCQ